MTLSIVSESDPMCELRVQPSTVIYSQLVPASCTVKYSGKWAPVMRWYLITATDNSTEDLADSNPTVNDSTTNDCVVSKRSVALPMGYASRIVCVLQFASLNISDICRANNTPVYNYTWISPSLISSMGNHYPIPEITSSNSGTPPLNCQN